MADMNNLDQLQLPQVAEVKTPTVEEVKKEILEFCVLPKGKDDILRFINVELKPYNFKKYVTRLLEDRYLQHTIPHNPRSNQQQYVASKKGLGYLKAIG